MKLAKIHNETLKIIALEKALTKVFTEDDDAAVITEHINGSVYLRQMDLKADTLITGKLHKTSHFSILLKGKARINMGDGRCVVAEAPYIFTTKELTKRLIYAITDISMINIIDKYEKGKQVVYETNEVNTALGIE